MARSCLVKTITESLGELDLWMRQESLELSRVEEVHSDVLDMIVHPFGMIVTKNHLYNHLKLHKRMQRPAEPHERLLLGLPICAALRILRQASIWLPEGGNRRHARLCDIRPAFTPQDPPPDRLEILGRHFCMDATLVNGRGLWRPLHFSGHFRGHLCHDLIGQDMNTAVGCHMVVEGSLGSIYGRCTLLLLLHRRSFYMSASVSPHPVLFSSCTNEIHP